MARSTSERGELVLSRRTDGRLELRANGIFVMDTAETSTERALAARALALHPAPAHVLVGGLGLGYTLAEVLSADRVRRCTVVEIEPALVSWLAHGLVPGAAELLADPRVEVQVADVADVLAQTPPAAYDAVLLDVDNGPGHLVHTENAGLYRPSALADAGRVLRPGGRVVVWSAAESPTLERTMRESLGEVEAVPHPVDLQGRAETYWLYAATAPD